VATIPYAELHAHTNFSFLDGASAADDLVERAIAKGLTALAVTDHNGLYGAVRFMGAAEEAGLHGIVGTEIDLLDPAVPDHASIVILPRRRPRRRRAGPTDDTPSPAEGRPARPRAGEAARPPRSGQGGFPRDR
jgi:error-prone DNA polymerase